MQYNLKQNGIIILKVKTLRQRSIHAGLWTIGGHALSQVIRLASNLILTRLLVPEMFGLMTLANLLLVGVWLFSDLGLKQSVVQSSRGHEPTFLNTAWVVQIVRGIVMWLMALLVALGVYIMGK